MDLSVLYEYCTAKKQVTEGFPFGEGVLVLRVAGKMFALISLDDNPLRINLKCDPERAVELRDQYEVILPGYHMNKKHWNTVVLDGTLSDVFVFELVDHSYDSMVATLPKTVRKEFE